MRLKGREPVFGFGLVEVTVATEDDSADEKVLMHMQGLHREVRS
jgi:hypothetical protein